MHPLCFIICLLFSVGMLVSLILLAIFPIELPITAKSSKQTPLIVRHHKARSPTVPRKSNNYWDTLWEDDNEDL